MYTKRVSGPYPLSCITCRERRKKCDRTHPTCNRCKKGGFTCLGYASRERPVDDQPETSTYHQSTPRSSEPPSDRHYVAGPAHSDGIRLPTNHPSLSALHAQRYHSDTSTLAQVSRAVALALPVPTRRPDGSLLNDNLAEWHGHTAPYMARPSVSVYPKASRTSYSREAHLSRDVGSDSEELNRPNRIKRRFEGFKVHRTDEPYSELTIYPDLDSSVTVVEFISSQYQRAYHMMTVDLVFHKRNFVQNNVLAGIKISKNSCWSLFLGAKIFQAMMSPQGRITIKPYLKVLDRFGKHLSSINLSNIVTREPLGWLSAALEMFEMKLLVDYYGAHRFLRQTVPIFTQVVCADSKLRSPQGNAAVFSLYGALTSSYTDVIRFAVGDVAMAMSFGLPHLVPWDTTSLSNVPQSERVEWWPGYPAEFLVAFAKVNSWRYRPAYNRDLDEWRQIERDVKEWRPCYNKDHPTESWGAVTRLAAQEALRHSALIYLYMGMCGVTSSDSRVQESCRQIIQILCLVNANPDIALHFFHPAMVAGVCAINEKHRAIVRDALCLVRECKVFMFQGFDFPEVMDRLWHGAGTNGAQVTWEDYLDACQHVINLDK